MATTGTGNDNEKHQWAAQEAVHKRNYLAIRDFSEQTRELVRSVETTVKGLQANLDIANAKITQLESRVNYLLAKVVSLGGTVDGD